MLFRALGMAAAYRAALLSAFGFSLFGPIGAAAARDFGQWDPNDPVTHWFANLMQPDNPKESCCGEADAYWADEVHVEQDETGRRRVIAIITDDRDDGPLKRIHEDIGTRYVVPPSKITRKDGNPTGHVVIFLGTNEWWHNGRTRPVLCYVMNGGA